MSKLPQTATEIIKMVKADNRKFLLLYGELGVGKTALTKDICFLLGVEDTVVSPTFVLNKVYTTKDDKIRTISHFDLYRIKDKSELLTIGWSVDTNADLTIVEWPELVANSVEKSALKVLGEIINGKHVFKVI